MTQLTSLLLTLAPLAAVGAALFGLIYLALRSSVGTIALVLALWIVTIAMRDSVDLSTTFATVQVSALDVIAVVLATVGLTRALSGGIRSVGVGLAVALVLLLVVHVARGAIEFDTQFSINASRGWLYLAGGLLYAATVPGGWNQSIWKVLIAAGIAVA
ncbi:MAG TPA: hypothetical protein VFH61_04065, partial [Thermoleophilia bacterium]|nr:hypothetical protein [Thermoleophilia bacterium]